MTLLAATFLEAILPDRISAAPRYAPRPMDCVPAPTHRSHGVLASGRPSEPGRHDGRCEGLVGAALALLGLLVFAPLQVAAAVRDSSASSSGAAPDSTLRWQFDTGG